MSPARSRLTVVLWTVAALAVLWTGFGDRVLTHLAYAMERGRIQASSAELAELQADLPEVYAVSRAFKLVSKVARPGVVHIRVSGGDAGAMAEEDIQEYLREHLQDVLPLDEPNDTVSPDGPAQPQRHQARPEPEDSNDVRPQTPSDEADTLRDKQKDLRQQIERWLRRLPPPPGSGSGIIFDPEGYILTNNHVVAGRSAFRVILSDDREYDAKLIGTDPKSDLAVVKIDAPDLHPLAFGDSDKLEVGDWVLAVGSPFDLRQTVTHGIVSAKGRTRVAGVRIDYQDFIQTDAAVNPGNSGGPLLNLRGEVVGVNTAIATHGDGVNAGIAFTIPSRMAVKVAHQLKTSGVVTRGWLGVSFTELQDDDVELFGLSARVGVFVESVLIDSPAERAGLQVEDVLTAINGVPIEGSEQLREVVADLTPGDTARLRVVRDRREITADVQLGEQPQNLAGASVSRSAEARAVARLGLLLRTYRPGVLRQGRLPHPATERGVLVWGLDPHGTETPDLARFELIVGCNDKPVRSVRELNDVLKDVPPGERVRLEILEPSGDRRIVPIKPSTSR